jgi:hypothetical protein
MFEQLSIFLLLLLLLLLLHASPPWMSSAMYPS